MSGTVVFGVGCETCRQEVQALREEVRVLRTQIQEQSPVVEKHDDRLDEHDHQIGTLGTQMADVRSELLRLANTMTVNNLTLQSVDHTLRRIVLHLGVP